MIPKILLWIFAVSAVIGAWDYLRGNRHGFGDKFVSGIRAFEPLFLSMAGIIVLIPAVQTILMPVIVPVCRGIGMDPSIPAGVLLANDMGAFQLAHSLTENAAAADFSGMILGSVLGVNLVFNLPVALKMIPSGDRPFLFRGMIYGFLTLPIGCFAGCVTAGYSLTFTFILLIPVLVISAAAGILLKWIPEKLTAFLGRMGRVVEILALTGAAAGIFAALTGLVSPRFLTPVEEGVKTVGGIVMVLPGAYVFLELLNRFCSRFFRRLGNWIGVNEHAVLGLFTTLTNDIPTFQMISRMDDRGKFLNFAFMTAGSFALGDHLAFCCAAAPHLAGPLLSAKIAAAVSALLIAWAEQEYTARKQSRKNG